MFKAKEIVLIVFFSILLGALLKIRSDISVLLISVLIGILSFFIVLGLNIIAKKLTARYLDTSIELKTWTFERFGFKATQHLKKPFPIGIVAPVVIALVSLGYFVWLACIEFEPSPLSSRVTKRHGLYRYSELTEIHIALIAAAGVAVNLLFSIPFYLLSFSEIAKFSIFLAAWSLVPLGSLDGSKILFGSRILWMSLVLITIIFLSYALFLPQLKLFIFH